MRSGQRQTLCYYLGLLLLTVQWIERRRRFPETSAPKVEGQGTEPATALPSFDQLLPLGSRSSFSPNRLVSELLEKSLARTKAKAKPMNNQIHPEDGITDVAGTRLEKA